MNKVAGCASALLWILAASPATALVTVEAGGDQAQQAPIGKPGILARIAEGRAINVKCMGAGSPTVILTAGLGDSEWGKVQPQVAQVTKVCFWDRPGSGFSSKSTGRETAADTTADLVAAL